MKTLTLLASAAVLLAGTGAARAQGPASTVLSPGTPVAAPDSANAVMVNPAALAHLPTWSVEYTHADAPSGIALADRGDALRLATPLLFGVSAGVAVESVRPTAAAGGGARGTGTLALAYAVSERIGVGANAHVTASGDVSGGLVGVDLAASWRPSDIFALSILARDINGPSDVGSGGFADVPASFVLAGGFRPTGTDALTLDVSGSLNTDGGVDLRGMVLGAVPYIGRVFVAADVNSLDARATWRVTSGLSFDWGTAGVGGGVLVGDSWGGAGGFATAHLEGERRVGIPTARVIADLKVEGTGERGILGLLMRLDRAAHDDRVAGVLLRLRGSGIGTAYAQEVREAISKVRHSGKPVVCHLDAAEGPEFFACAASTTTLIDPAGGVRLVGPSSDTLLLGEALSDLGIRTEFVRIGEYKSAPEMFTNRVSSAPARESREALYDDVYGQLVNGLAQDWHTSDARVRTIIDGGPYLASEMKAAHLVHGEADELAMNPELRRAFGGDFELDSTLSPTLRNRWGKGRRIGVVVVDGDIVDGDNIDIPVIGIHGSGGTTISQTIDRLAQDPTVAVIVLRIDSPGGSVMASDQMWRAARRARLRKPVIASMGSVAASGGYYLASAADEIWADPATITGSIGVFFGKVDFAKLAGMLHIGVEGVARGKRAGFESLWRPFTDDQRRMVSQKVESWYQLFLRRVAEGRKMKVAAVDKVARGRVWSGAAAKERGLVDKLGGFTEVLARARQLGDVDEHADVGFAPSRPSTLLDYVLISLGLARASEDVAPVAADGVPAALRSVASAAMGLGAIAGGIPAARLEEVVLRAP